MNATAKNILATLVTALVIGNFTFLWQVNARLTAIETTLHYISGQKTIAEK